MTTTQPTPRSGAAKKNVQSLYGTTIYVGATLPALSQRVIDGLAAIAPGAWVRWLYPMSALNPQGGSVWNFAQLDDAVARCNKAGVHLFLALANLPKEVLTISAKNGAAVTAGTGDFAPVSYWQRLSAVVAARYSGQSGHGLIAALGFENELYDMHNPRDIQFRYLVPVIAECAPIIRKLHPSCLLASCAMRRTVAGALDHYQACLENLFTFDGGIGKDDLDVIDMHAYFGQVPHSPLDSTTLRPSITEEVATIRGAMASYNSTASLWCTETGFDIYHDVYEAKKALSLVTPQEQADYLLMMLRTFHAQGGACFVYTYDDSGLVRPSRPTYSTSPKSIVQTINGVYTEMPAVAAIKADAAAKGAAKGKPMPNTGA